MGGGRGLTKAIIEGKRYDTETATLICSGSADTSKSNFRYWSASLYVTKNGNYFLDGEGGPMTRWSRSFDNSCSGGAGVIPIDAAEALAFAERHGGVDVVERFFEADIKDA
jgi:hypothetical protein